jgi:hypothetical protein
MIDLLWAIPPVALTAAAALTLVQLRGVAEAAADVQLELRRFSEVQLAVAQVRSASAEARATARSPRR